MDYRDAALFTRVVEAGGFTAAAQLVGLPKSSLSRRVARLERELGVRLLQRTTRKLTLTEAGHAFYERVRRAVLGLEEAASTAREADGEPRGLVRITAPPDSASLGLGAIAARFTEKYPAIQLELSLSTRVVDLVGEGFDLAVRGGALSDSSLVARRLGSMDFGLFAAPEYLARRGTPATLAELSSHECILFRPRAGRARWLLHGPDGEHTVEVQGRVSADEFGFIAHLAREGSGIALLPLLIARDSVREQRLAPLLPDYRSPGSPISVVLPSSEFVPSRVALFRDALVEAISSELEATRRECSAAHGKRSLERARGARPQTRGRRRG